jgi:hypothetical protein
MMPPALSLNLRIQASLRSPELELVRPVNPVERRRRE